MGIGIGCSCHCTRPATIWKISCATGEIVWRADRVPLAAAGRGASMSLDLYHDGADLWIYEAGPVPVEGGNHVTKWKDLGDSAERQWDALDELPDSSSYWNDVIRAENGNVWWLPPRAGVTNAWQLADADGSVIASTGLPFGGPQFCPGARATWVAPREGVFIASVGSTIDSKAVELQQYDSTFAQVAATTGVSTNHIPGDWAPIDGDPSVGFITKFGGVFPFTPKSYRAYGPSIALINSLADANPLQVVRDGSNAGKFLAANASRLQMRDNATLALDWEVLLSDSFYPFRQSTGRISDAGDAYLLHKLSGSPFADGTRTATKVSGGGVVQWQTSLDVDEAGFGDRPSVCGMIIDEDRGLLLLFGNRFEIDSEFYQVVALSLGDGAVAWKTNLNSGASIVGSFGASVNDAHHGRLHGEHLYVCGEKM